MKKSCDKITNFLEQRGKRNTINLFEKVCEEPYDYYKFAKIDECSFEYKYTDERGELIIRYNKSSKHLPYYIHYLAKGFCYKRNCTSQESIVTILKNIETMEFMGVVIND